MQPHLNQLPLIIAPAVVLACVSVHVPGTVKENVKVAAKVIALADARHHVLRHVNNNVPAVVDRLVKDVASNFVHRIVLQNVKISVLPRVVVHAHLLVKVLVVVVVAAVAVIHVVADVAPIAEERVKELAVMVARPLMPVILPIK